MVEDELYSERFLVKRPLLRAIAYEADALGAVAPPVLLVDEVDRADDEFEAFLLEILSDYTVTVPELGTFHAVDAAARRRHVEPHPRRARRARSGDASTTGSRTPTSSASSRSCACARPRCPTSWRARSRRAVESLRELELYKPPGVAETIDWANALAALGRTTIDEHAVEVTLGTILKYREDQDRTRAAGIEQLVAQRADRRRSAVPDPVSARRVDRLAVGFARLLRGAGLDVPVGHHASLFAEALGAVGVVDARRGVLGGPGDARAAARGRRALRPRLRRVVGPRASGSATAAAQEREVMLAFDTDGDDDAPPRPTTASATSTDARGALQPGRGAAPA